MMFTLFRSLLRFLAVFFLSGAALSSFTQVRENTKDVWLEWVKETAHQLSTLDWQAVDLEDLQFLDDELKGKRIVFLGEPDHYIQEKYDFRLILIRYLFTKGWRYIGMEMGRSDGMRADKFLETGDPIWLERMALYGYKGDRRTDRDDTLKVIRGKRDPEFAKSLLDEEKWFFHQLHLLNKNLTKEQSRLHWFGYDLDVYPGGGYKDTCAILEKYPKHALIKKIFEKLERVENETVEQEVSRLRKLLDFIIQNNKDLIKILGEKDARELEATVHCLHDSMRFLIATKAGFGGGAMLAHYRKREQSMFRQMDEILEILPLDTKIILMGHNGHLSKDYKNFHMGSTPMWPSIGTHLNQKLPDEVYAIWMLYDHGRHANVYEQMYETVRSHPQRIEYVLAQAGEIFLLPLDSRDPRAAYLDKKCYFGVNGDFGSGLLRNNADAIFFVSEVKATGEEQQ